MRHSAIVKAAALLSCVQKSLIPFSILCEERVDLRLHGLRKALEMTKDLEPLSAQSWKRWRKHLTF